MNAYHIYFLLLAKKMEELKDIPKKSVLPVPFVKSLRQLQLKKKKCLICGHLDEVHEQVSYYLCDYPYQVHLLIKMYY